ncbi:UNVERIFIED_CONTAM: hypothetical protein Sangu_2459500 [Sesamum angustifolium]|uniref:Uncharacterized protein n=1 Tax=Sesamum angustifolium TaxID=2727405 RepID=A0AAW2ITX9_9LAMI
MPQELANNLLHVPLQGEALVDPKDPMVEDIDPLKVVPPAEGDNITSSCMRLMEMAACGL